MTLKTGSFYSCGGRAVKAKDLKSFGLCPRRFESCPQRFFVVLAERLRRETANFMGYARASSNLAHDAVSVCPSGLRGEV